MLADSATRIRPLLRVHARLPACEVPPDVADAMAAAAHEALINIAKHADVDAALMRLTCGTRGVIVEIVDAGVGFDPIMVPFDQGGLHETIGARLNDIDGWAQVWSATGAGCVITMGWRPIAS